MKWVYIFISDLTRNEYDYYFSLMDVNKQKQVSRYKNEIDKKRTVAGEMLARRMISKYCNVLPEDIYFETGCYGKPNAKNLNVEFNTVIQRKWLCVLLMINLLVLMWK